MSYQALYRVWRPQRFEDIAGQQAVTRTLKNALEQINLATLIYSPVQEGQGKQVRLKFLLRPLTVQINKTANHVMNVTFVRLLRKAA